jgi:tRNA threonylcarbamoyladenosine biosynthesis protein TsaB
VALILSLETATTVCSVALSREGNVLFTRESAGKNSHSEMLTTLISEVMQAAGLPLQALDAVAVSRGPGSYTGLRIGVATAKGLCYALGKPLLGVPTLQAMAFGMRERLRSQPGLGRTDEKKPLLFCPMIDARRMEVYRALYNMELEEVAETAAEVIDENTFDGWQKTHTLILAGEGSSKCIPVLAGQHHVVFLEDFHASATHLASLAEGQMKAGKHEDLAYFEPFYLKDFIAGKPRVKGLH